MMPARINAFVRYVAVAVLCKVALVLALAAAPAHAGTLKLIAIGDSLIHGYGVEQGKGFVPQLEAWLRAQGEDVTVINMGVSGDTTEGGRARLGWALADGADAVILELGGNDLLRGIDPTLSRANLDAMLTELGQRGIPVLLAGLEAPLNYGPEFKEAFDGMYAELAAKHDAILYPSFIAGLEGAEGVLQDDGIHPNPKGVGLIVSDLGPKVRELLARARAGE
jgi:acyl-CoA thioesterase-1